MRELSLFTGAGGGLLGSHLLGWTPIGYVEWNEYCQRVIAGRIADGYLPSAPIFTDVREFVQSGAARQYRGIADVVSGGFPCQPFSIAGKQQAAEDARNMWPATLEVIRIVQPRSVLLENVPGLVSCGYIGTVLTDLASLGIVGKWGILGARDVGAPHKRERLWIVGHSHRNGCKADNGWQPVSDELGDNPAHAGGWQEFKQGLSCAGNVANADVTGEEKERNLSRVGRFLEQTSQWQSDPSESPHQSGLGRVAYGMADRMDRLKAIGNGQVPAVAATAWELLR